MALVLKDPKAALIKAIETPGFFPLVEYLVNEDNAEETFLLAKKSKNITITSWLLKKFPKLRNLTPCNI